MKLNTEALISELIEHTRQNINKGELFLQMSLENLNQKSTPESWSILECLEHLNLYGDFYLPEIEREISKSTKEPTAYFKPGILGNYFTQMMIPDTQLKKMKTFKDKNPAGSTLDKSTIHRFQEQQKRTLELLNKARKVNLKTVKTKISISRMIRLRLGDTLRFVVFHNDRHIAQALRVVQELEQSKTGEN